MPKPPTDEEINALVKKSNAFLKASHIRARILRQGDRLYLRATLPPKPGTQRVKPFQQKIALFLPCSKQGIRLAQNKAIKLGSELIEGEFEWADWWTPRVAISTNTAGYWIAKFAEDYRQKNTLSDRTWKNGWLQYLDVLDSDADLTAPLLIEAVLSKQPNTAQRKNICTRLQKLADFAGIDIDLTQYRGNYGRAKVKPRDLPTDELINEWATSKRIVDPAWRRVFGLMAAFGLRPHEAFLGHLRDDGKYQVLEGKTGSRIVSPFYPEWVDQWDLWPEILPDVDIQKAKKGQQLGNFAHGYLRRKYKVPFQLYDLRHAYAIRVHTVFGLSETVGARLMGHAPNVHLTTYQRWLGEDAANKAINRVLSREDRPRAPR